MIRRKLLIVTAITGYVLIAACSDTTAPKRFAPGTSPAAAILGAPCAAPGTGMAGALNMLHDAKMFTVPMVRDAAQGNAGMFHAVAVSGC